MSVIELYNELKKNSDNNGGFLGKKSISKEEVLETLLKKSPWLTVGIVQGCIREGGPEKKRRLELLGTLYSVTNIRVDAEKGTITFCVHGDNQGWVADGKMITVTARGGVGWYRVDASSDNLCFFCIEERSGKRHREQEKEIIDAAFAAAHRKLPGAALTTKAALDLFQDVLTKVGEEEKVLECFCHGTPPKTTADLRLLQLRWEIDQYEALGLGMTFEQAGKFLNKILQYEAIEVEETKESKRPRRK